MPAISPPPEAPTTATSGFSAELVQVLADLAAGGALPRDHQRIVERRHQHRAALLRDVAGDRRAVLVVAVVQHDLGAERRGALALGRRRIRRHHDHRRHAAERRRVRHALGVIAGRIGHHAVALLRSGGIDEILL